MARLDNSSRQKFLDYMGKQRGGQGFTGEQFQQFNQDEQAFAAGFPDFAKMGQQPTQPSGQQNGQVVVQPLPAQKQTIVPPQGVTGGGQVQQPDQNQQSQDEWQGAFNSSYGQPNFNAGLDINLDGKIDFNDYQQYNANGGQKNIYSNRNSAGVYVDEKGNPIGVTQPGNDPGDDVVFGGGPRFEGGFRAPGGNFLGVDGSFSPGGGQFTGGGFQPGGQQPGGSPASGISLDQIFADPRFGSLFGQSGFQGINDRVGGAETALNTRFDQLGGQVGGRFNNVDSALGGIRSAQDSQTNLLGGQIGSGFSGVNDRFSNIDSVLSGMPEGVRSVLEPFMRQGFGDVNSNIGNVTRGIGEGFGNLNTGLDSRFSGLQSGIDSQFSGLSDRFSGLDTGQRNIQDLLGTGAGSLQSRIGQELGGVNNNINDRFNSLNGGIAGLDTNITNRFDGLGSDISNRFNNQDARFNSLDTGIGGIRGDITGLGDNITGLTGNVDARYNDIQGLIDSLGGQFGNLAGDVNSRTQIGDLLKNFTGEQFDDPSIYGTVESAIKSRLGGAVADDPRVQSQLADLDKSQLDRKNQRIEDLKRMGINADDGNYFSEGDEMSEQFNRERLNVLANGENMRTADFGTGLNLGNSQGDLDVNQARINLDKFLGTGDLGVREKEADARIKSIDAQIKQAQQRRDDDFLSDLFGTAAKFLPFLL
jgi:Flp pilus assembly pilin Flp